MSSRGVKPAADSFATIFDDEFALIGFNPLQTPQYGIDASLEHFIA